MSPSLRRIFRVTIASVFGTAAGLWALRSPLHEPPPQEVGISEVSFDPSMSDMRLRVTLNGKRGFVDGSGQTVIEPTFALAMPFSEGLAAVANRTGPDGQPQWQFVNASGVVVFARCFNGGQIGTFHEGLAPIAVNGKWGYIDLTGNFAVPTTYDGADDFSEGLAAVRTGRKFGVIGRDGKVVLEPTYDFIGSYKNGRVIFATRNRFGYLDSRGQVAVEPTFDSASDFSEGLAFVNMKGEGHSLGGYVDLSGKYAISPAQIHGGPFRQGLASVQTDTELYFINKAGETVLKPEGAKKLGNFSEGLASAMFNGRVGFIDLHGNVVITPQWEYAGEFDRGVARVSAGNVRGYINRQGKYVWKLQM